MSYCRFSSANWRSDVYVYGSVWGIEVIVASKRRMGPIPLVTFDREDIDSWVDDVRAQHDALENMGLIDIGGPFDGAKDTYGTYAGAAKRLQEVRAAGYVVPDGVIESLYEDADEFGEDAC